jgi:hypothetical protein
VTFAYAIGLFLWLLGDFFPAIATDKSIIPYIHSAAWALHL